MEHMRRLRPRALVWLSVLFAAVLAGVFAASVSGSHAEQKWAGFWHFTHLNSPTIGLQGGFAFQHRLDEQKGRPARGDRRGRLPRADRLLHGRVHAPDTEDLPPNTALQRHRQVPRLHDGRPPPSAGRYESNSNPRTAAGDIELTSSSPTSSAGTALHVRRRPAELHLDGVLPGPLRRRRGGSLRPALRGAAAGGTGAAGPPARRRRDPLRARCARESRRRSRRIPTRRRGLPSRARSAMTSIVGTDGPDRILGLGGNDTDLRLRRRRRADRGGRRGPRRGRPRERPISGDDGEDYLAGDYPSYQLSPTGGDDQVSGNEGNDVIESGPGNDTASGGRGEDKV